MDKFQKINFISLSLQKLLYELYENNKKLTFETQNVYKYRQQFNSAMKKLIKWNVVEKRDCFINGRKSCIFLMNIEGVLFFEEYLQDFDRCQKRA